LYPIGGYLSIVPFCTRFRLPSAPHWRRVTFIVTSGEHPTNAVEIDHLFEGESPAGQWYVRLNELGILVEREWWID
jgi:hypothetical protein